MAPLNDTRSPLPRLPTKKMTQEELDAFSRSLIDSYWSVRVTTPYPRTQGIKNVRIQLPPIKRDLPDIELENPAVKALSSNLEIPVESDRIRETRIVPEKCFLHPKPKLTCPRCKLYLEWKRVSPESCIDTKRSRIS
jgi:hypothetical protein